MPRKAPQQGERGAICFLLRGCIAAANMALDPDKHQKASEGTP
jgi:hypothetical protein